MSAKLLGLLVKWLGFDPNRRYLTLLEHIDSTGPDINALPILITEFWNRLDLKHFQPDLSFREMMYINIKVRTTNIVELCYILDQATNAIVQDDHDTLVESSVVNCKTVLNLTLDDYFSYRDGTSMGYQAGLLQLKQTLVRHLEVIEHIKTTTHCRLLNKVYNEVFVVTWILINNMPKR